MTVTYSTAPVLDLFVGKTYTLDYTPMMSSTTAVNHLKIFEVPEGGNRYGADLL